MTAALRKGVPLEERSAATDIVVNGERLSCCWTGCLYWADQATLIVSDLHLEKGSSLARKGSFIPPYDTSATLARLVRAIDQWQPDRVISLGDSFHDPFAAERLEARDKQTLLSFTRNLEWIWITGNHDPQVPDDLGGTGAREMLLGNLTFRHEPQRAAQTREVAGEVAGHLHPAGKIRRRTKSVRRPCFVTDGSRLIMPAFGAYTGGLNIRDRAFHGLFDEASMSAVLLGQGRVFHIAARNLVV